MLWVFGGYQWTVKPMYVHHTGLSQHTQVFSFIRMPTKDVRHVITEEELPTYVCYSTRSHAIETSPSSAANNHSTIQEFQNILWNQNVHWQFHTSLQLVPVLSQMNTVNTVHTTPVKLLYSLDSCRSNAFTLNWWYMIMIPSYVI